MTFPVSIPMALAIFFTMWWTVLFAVLPFGVKGQHEGPEVVTGSEPGAPQQPLMIRKALWTTLVTGVLFTGLMFALVLFPDA